MKADKRLNITTELAYLAGFFDGEGCIRIKKAYNRSKACWITVQISNADRLVLERYEKLFGGSVFTRGHSTNFQMYMYESSSTEAVDFLKSMIGYLRGKRKQAEYALWFAENMNGMDITERHAAHDKMREMKLEVIGNIHENPELLAQPPAKEEHSNAA